MLENRNEVKERIAGAMKAISDLSHVGLLGLTGGSNNKEGDSTNSAKD